MNLLRRAPRQVPAAPADTTWDPATRTLSTTALAARATAVILPAAIPFVPGSVYQLWLIALNSKGHSLPGPVQTWTAG